jgi:carbon monoxide dehydrogenase subunit G
MQLEHHFTVPVPPDVAWEALLDPERVAPCFPGATLQSAAGSEFTGTVKVRLGPVALLYKGKGVFTATDPEARRTVIEASAKDTRGNGTAAANVAVTVRPDAEGTAVDLTTDLKITGRPAQLGRGLISDVSGKIVATFADCLAARLAEQPTAESAGSSSPKTDTTGPAGSADAPPSAAHGKPHSAAHGKPHSAAHGKPHSAAHGKPPDASAQSEINLIEVAGPPVLKRVALVLLAALVLLLVVRKLFRRR